MDKGKYALTELFYTFSWFILHKLTHKPLYQYCAWTLALHMAIFMYAHVLLGQLNMCCRDMWASQQVQVFRFGSGLILIWTSEGWSHSELDGRDRRGRSTRSLYSLFLTLYSSCGQHGTCKGEQSHSMTYTNLTTYYISSLSYSNNI